jgi:hypothetical protein
MCEFCHQHGEGKVWYLQIKNYLTDLLHSDLSPEQQEIIGAKTWQEWLERFMSFPGYSALPASGGTGGRQPLAQEHAAVNYSVV